MRQVPCGKCGGPNRNTGKNKDGSWYAVCYSCGYKMENKEWKKRRQARIAWNQVFDPEGEHNPEGGPWV